MRNRRRTALSLIAVALGMALLMVLNGLVQGALEDALQYSIRYQTGHVQVRKDSYEEEKLSLKWKDLLEEPEALAARAQALPEVKYAAPVLWLNGIVNTSDDSAGVRVFGIDVSSPVYQPIRDATTAGAFLTADDRNGILIGKRLADELGVDVGRKIVLDIVDASGRAQESTFIIRGLFTTGLPFYDQNSIFLPIAKAQAFAGTGDRASAVVVMLRHADQADKVTAALQGPGLKVLTWKDLNAILLATARVGLSFYYILDLIVMLIVAVIIANTLLMAVFERVREIGILSALGMRSAQIRIMFLLEAILLGMAGILAGAMVGSIGVAYLAHVGLAIGDVATVGGGAYLMGTRMYARFMPGLFAGLGAATLFVVVLAALYPAWFASRLEPVEALRAL
ncbi:MAG: ABC transporter permease [Anaerolineae bacterium]|nr:ABC transporter permease [Anaerolineae bacterium]